MITEQHSVAAALLHRLVERHLNKQQLPVSVTAEDGTPMLLGAWLTELRHDRSEFSSHLASRLNMMAQPALVSEVALSLRDRLEEAAPAATELAEPDTYPPLPSAVWRPSN
jgi:hypothetical protein